MGYAARWLAFVDGRASQTSLFGDNRYWRDKFLEVHQNHLPFAAINELTGLKSRVLERWIEHPYYDDYWRNMNPGPGDYAEFDIPILTITGYFDGDQPGAMRYYRDHMTYGSESGTAKHYLIMGPWSHGGTRAPQKELGGLVFGDNSVIDMEQLHLEWFDWIFRDGDQPEMLTDRVTYYVMESNEWRHAPSLEETATDQQIWYLGSVDGQANDVFHSGRLSVDALTSPGVDSYFYDPLQTLEDYDELAALGDFDGAG
ncbi:MAG: CocE/NonD family hydrolase, partial [Gemmatimonadales bacterium]